MSDNTKGPEAAPQPAPKRSMWARAVDHIEKRPAGYTLAVALGSMIVALFTGIVSAAQAVLFMNERSTPYRAPVHSAQIDAAKQIASTAGLYWQALDAGMLGCRMVQSGDPTWNDDMAKARLEHEADAFYDFEKGGYGAWVVLSPRVSEKADALSRFMQLIAVDYGSRNCQESVKLNAKFTKDSETFRQLYFDFIDAARKDASIDALSERPDMRLPGATAPK